MDNIADGASMCNSSNGKVAPPLQRRDTDAFEKDGSTTNFVHIRMLTYLNGQ
jgi:hypothetical protein